MELGAAWPRLCRSRPSASASVVLLLRIPGLPAWGAIFGEDYFWNSCWGLSAPLAEFVPFGGYEQLLQRLVAQFVAYLPMADAITAFARPARSSRQDAPCSFSTPAPGTSGPCRCAVLLAAAVMLLSIAPMEIADSTVAVSFYLLLACSGRRCGGRGLGRYGRRRGRRLCHAASNSLVTVRATTCVRVTSCAVQRARGDSGLAGGLPDAVAHRLRGLRYRPVPADGLRPAAGTRPASLSPSTPTTWYCARSAGTCRGGFGRSREETGPQRSRRRTGRGLRGDHDYPARGPAIVVTALFTRLHLLHGLHDPDPVGDSLAVTLPSRSRPPATPRLPTS